MGVYVLIALQTRNLTGTDIIIMDQQYSFIPAKACDKLLPYIVAKATDRRYDTSGVLTAGKS